MKEDLNYSAYRERVAEFLGRAPESFDRETRIYDELGVDSLGIFSLGMHLIKCFGVKLPLAEVSTIATIGDMYDALVRHRLLPEE